MAVLPEDILPDDVNTTEINGVTVRKGTIGAVLANARILASSQATDDEKTKAREAIKILAPVLIALEVHQHIVWKNPDIQKIIDEALVK